MSAVERISVLMSFNYFLAQMELAAQLMQNHRRGLAVPHFLSGVGYGVAAVSGTKALITASKKAFMHGIQVGSFFSALPAMVNAGKAGSTGNTRVALMYAGSGAGYVASTVIAGRLAARTAAAAAGKAVPAMGAAAGAVFKPWVAVALSVASAIVSGVASLEFFDRIRLAVRHSIWGERNGQRPPINEGALGRWWIELDDEGSLDAEVRPITFSNRPMDEDWHDQLMMLRVTGRSDEIRETFNRNCYLLNVAVQFPPTAITAQTSDSVLSQVEVSHYAINVSGLQAPTIIESVHIKLISISGQSLYDKVYKYEPQGDDLPLLPLLSDGRGRTIPRALEAMWAEQPALGGVYRRGAV